MTLSDASVVVGFVVTGLGGVAFAVAIARMWGVFETELKGLKLEMIEMRRESKEGDTALATTLANAMGRMSEHGEALAALTAVSNLRVRPENPSAR